MSSVTIGLEVLAVVVLLIVMAVGCCCVAFCVFQMMEQEFRRNERMINAEMQTRIDVPSAGIQSIEVLYHPQEYRNVNYGLMPQQPQQLRQAPGTTRTETTRITTTFSSTPAAPPTQATESTLEYTGTETQRFTGAQGLVLTANENDETNQTPVKSDKLDEPEQDAADNPLVHVLDDQNPDSHTDHSEKQKQEKKFEGLKHKTQVLSQVSRVSQISEKDLHQKKEYPHLAQLEAMSWKEKEEIMKLDHTFLHTPDTPDEKNVQQMEQNEIYAKQEQSTALVGLFDEARELVKQKNLMENATSTAKDITSVNSNSYNDHGNPYGFTKKEMEAWMFIQRKQMACINAERDGWLLTQFTEQNQHTQQNEQNEKSTIAKKTD